MLQTFLALALTAAGSLTAAQPTVYKGTIKQLQAAAGDLTLTGLAGGKDRTFGIARARIIDEGKSEIKVGDLNVGDQVEVEMDGGGKIVNEVRVVKRKGPA
jgi:riboflavin synthase alpha subunit